MCFQFWFYQANSSTLKWGRSQSLKWCHLPKILLKESSPVNATTHMRWVTIQLHSFLIPEVEWGEQSHVPATGKEAQHPLSRKPGGPQNQTLWRGAKSPAPVKYCSTSPQLPSPLFKLQKKGRLRTVKAPGKGWNKSLPNTVRFVSPDLNSQGCY